jgi:hypothetical protein
MARIGTYSFRSNIGVPFKVSARMQPTLQISIAVVNLDAIGMAYEKLLTERCLPGGKDQQQK